MAPFSSLFLKKIRNKTNHTRTHHDSSIRQPTARHTTETPGEKKLRLFADRSNFSIKAVDKRPVRSTEIRGVPLQISVVKIKLRQESNELCEQPVEFCAAMVVRRGGDRGMPVHEVKGWLMT